MNRPFLHNKPPLLEVRDLSLRFHKQATPAIDRVSFRISAGRSLGLVGASGAGKSTIARVIMRLATPDSGAILFHGEDISEMNPRQLMRTRQRIQLVFQEPSASLSPRRNIQQTLLEPLQHFAIGDYRYQQQKISQTLKTVGLDDDVLQRYPHQFSSGQQQRIAIARALVTDPELLIADEAVASLDVSIQAQILQLIQSLQNDHGLTFLFISHDLAVIRQIADEVAVTYRGQLLEQSPADSFFSGPAHPYSRTLLSIAGHPGLPDLDAGPWQAEMAHISSGVTPACIYVQNCKNKMSICAITEPVDHCIPDKNQHTPGQHCVKCHLYDEVRSNET